MNKNFDNKRLVYILAFLLVILLVTMVVKIPRQNATIKDTLVSFDSSKVARIVVIPRGSSGDPFDFVRKDGRWILRQGNIIAKPSKNAAENIFAEILAIKPQSLVSNDKLQWKEYDLTDSLANRLKFLDGKGRLLADVMIGRISFKPVSNPYMQGRNNVEGKSYVRISSDRNIYATDGFLALSFSGKFNDWRDRSFIRSKKEDILKITFIFPGDSSFVLTKNDTGWMINDQKADSVKVSDYLSTISYVDGEEFADGYKPASDPDYTIIVEGNNLLNYNVKCYTDKKTGNYFLNSSQNPEVYFKSKSDGIYVRLVKSKKYFLVK